MVTLILLICNVVFNVVVLLLHQSPDKTFLRHHLGQCSIKVLVSTVAPTEPHLSNGSDLAAKEMMTSNRTTTVCDEQQSTTSHVAHLTSACTTADKGQGLLAVALCTPSPWAEVWTRVLQMPISAAERSMHLCTLQYIAVPFSQTWPRDKCPAN